MPGFTIPWGDHEGRSVLEIDLAEIPLDDQHHLTREVLHRTKAGHGFVRFTRAPWGDQNLNRALLQLLSDERTAVDVWVCRDVQEAGWANAPLYHVHDCSSLLRREVTVRGIMEMMGSLPYLPRPEEVIVRQPTPVSVNAAVLDEVALRLDARSGWVYVERGWDGEIAALREVERATTRWGVRYVPVEK